METKSFSDSILLGNARDVLRIHIYTLLIQRGVHPMWSENDISLIIELYLFGGYWNSKQQKEFIGLCIERGIKETEQSVRNSFSKYTKEGVFTKGRNKTLSVSEAFIPAVRFDRIVLEHVISHYAG